MSAQLPWSCKIELLIILRKIPAPQFWAEFTDNTIIHVGGKPGNPIVKASFLLFPCGRQQFYGGNQAILAEMTLSKHLDILRFLHSSTLTCWGTSPGWVSSTAAVVHGKYSEGNIGSLLTLKIYLGKHPVFDDWLISYCARIPHPVPFEFSPRAEMVQARTKIIKVRTLPEKMVHYPQSPNFHLRIFCASSSVGQSQWEGSRRWAGNIPSSKKKSHWSLTYLIFYRVLGV